MNSKTLKVIGAIILSCFVMIVVVIYTPKPTPQRSKKRRTFVNPQYLKLANEAFSLAIKANGIANGMSTQLLNGEKIDFSPLVAANTEAIDALAEADTSVKLSNEEFQRLNKDDTSLKTLIETNRKLIASLNQISETVEALNIEVQDINKENIQPPLPSLKKFIKAHRELTNAIQKGVKTLDKVIKAYSEFYQIETK